MRVSLHLRSLNHPMTREKWTDNGKNLEKKRALASFER